MANVKPENKFFNMMKKWGWDEGKGLGKKEDGTVDYVRIKKKDDNTGVGLVKAKEVVGNWWERLYDHRAKETIAEAEMLEAGSDLESSDDEDAEPVKLPSSAAAYAGRFVSRIEPEDDGDGEKTKGGKRGKRKRTAAVPSSVAAVVEHLDDVGQEHSQPPLDLHSICGGASFGKFTGHFRPEGKLKRLARQDAEHRATKLDDAAGSPQLPSKKASKSKSHKRATVEEEEEPEQEQEQQSPPIEVGADGQGQDGDGGDDGDDVIAVAARQAKAARRDVRRLRRLAAAATATASLSTILGEPADEMVPADSAAMDAAGEMDEVRVEMDEEVLITTATDTDIAETVTATTTTVTTTTTIAEEERDGDTLNGGRRKKKRRTSMAAEEEMVAAVQEEDVSTAQDEEPPRRVKKNKNKKEEEVVQEEVQEAKKKMHNKKRRVDAAVE